MDISVIRPRLDGRIDVSDDGGRTWVAFEGIVVNLALTEHYCEMNRLLKHMNKLLEQQRAEFVIG